MLHLHSIMNGIWAIDRDFASNYLPLLAAYMKADNKLNTFNLSSASGRSMEEITENNGVKTYSIKNGAYTLSEYGNWIRPEDAPQDSVAIINITGAITKYDQGCGPSGTKTKSELLARCVDNNKIKAVGFVIDSGGGQAQAMLGMDEAIREARKIKGVGAFVDDNAYSAAAGIASSCDFTILNNKNAGIGSYGTYATIVDYTEYYKSLGINIIEVYATASKDKNQPFIQALQGNTKLLEEIVNQANESFLSMVETNRGSELKAKRSEWGTGKTFTATQAKDMGLIDDIGNFSYFIDFFNT